jgi:hypothetical protein
MFIKYQTVNVCQILSLKDYTNNSTIQLTVKELISPTKNKHAGGIPKF